MINPLEKYFTGLKQWESGITLTFLSIDCHLQMGESKLPNMTRLENNLLFLNRFKLFKNSNNRLCLKPIGSGESSGGVITMCYRIYNTRMEKSYANP